MEVNSVSRTPVLNRLPEDELRAKVLGSSAEELAGLSVEERVAAIQKLATSGMARAGSAQHVHGVTPEDAKTIIKLITSDPQKVIPQLGQKVFLADALLGLTGQKKILLYKGLLENTEVVVLSLKAAETPLDSERIPKSLSGNWRLMLQLVTDLAENKLLPGVLKKMSPSTHLNVALETLVKERPVLAAEIAATIPGPFKNVFGLVEKTKGSVTQAQNNPFDPRHGLPS